MPWPTSPAPPPARLQEALHFLSSPSSGDVPAILDMCFKAGACNFGVMEMLSRAHTTT
jgi:hydroxylamine reductase